MEVLASIRGHSEKRTEYTHRLHGHRIPRVADSPTDTKLAFVPNTPTGKKRRAHMKKLINPNGEYLR